MLARARFRRSDFQFIVLLRKKVRMARIQVDGDASRDAEIELVPLPFPVVGYLINRPRRFHPRWLYCSVWNDSAESLFIYGPHHKSEVPCYPSSLYLLPPFRRTPRFWDCKGVLIPLGRSALFRNRTIAGPVALKYRDMRRVHVTLAGDVYACSRPNQILAPANSDLPLPTMSLSQLLKWKDSGPHVPI